MANVAKYDRQTVIHQAMELFWKKGLHGTSTRDLQQAVDMRPGSIYSAFGSKEGLFSEALKCYSAEMKLILEQRCADEKSALAGLEAFMRNVIVDRHDSNPSELCMLVKTLSELGDDHPELMDQTRDLMKRTEDRFTEVLERARSQGEIPDSSDPRILARHLQVQMIGLRTYMKTSRNPATVSDLIGTIFGNLKA